MPADLHAVTGAFGYSGQAIAQRLLALGYRVRTLTNSRHPNPFGDKIEVHPLLFDNPSQLAESLHGVSVLYNTYWVRFNYQTFNYASAVRNSLILFDAAKKAGVRRIVHTSITNPSEHSPLEYFRGKAQLEQALKQSGLSYAILRPAVLFGNQDILINNIAWFVRRFPLLPIPGDGFYRLRPIHVEDFATLAIEQGNGDANVTLDAVGPETITYRGLIQELADIFHRNCRTVSVPPSFLYWMVKPMNLLLRDVLLTRDEIRGLMAGLLDVDSPSTGTTRLTQWARENIDSLGLHYASELTRR